MTSRLLVRGGPTVAHYPPGATFGPRTLVDFEFVWLLGGSARWQGGGSTAELRPGTLLLARPGMTDRIAWDAARASLHAYAHFRLLDGGPLGDPATWPLTRPLTPADPMAALCSYALRLGQDPAAVSRTAEVLGWLLDLFVPGPFLGRDSLPAPSVHLERLADHVRSAWRTGGLRPLSLDELARGAGVSSGHLSRLFRDAHAIGPVRAFELVRLSRAATLLQRSNLPVGAVAATHGFANAFHFTRRFRTTYGLPPRDYRSAEGADDPLAPLARAGLLPLARDLLSGY